MPAKKEPKWKKEKCPECEHQGSEDCPDCEKGDMFVQRAGENGDLPAGETTESTAEATISTEIAESEVGGQLTAAPDYSQPATTIVQYDLEMKARPQVTTEYQDKEPAKVLRANGFKIITTDKGLKAATTRKKKETKDARMDKLITISPFSKVPVDHGQDGPRCASCLGDLIWNENGVGHFEKIPLVKVVPLGCPDCSIGGFIWQCPKCKTVTADWKAI